MVFCPLIIFYMATCCHCGCRVRIFWLTTGLPHTQGIFKLKKISGKFLVTQGTFFDSKSGNPVSVLFFIKKKTYKSIVTKNQLQKSFKSFYKVLNVIFYFDIFVYNF